MGGLELQRGRFELLRAHGREQLAEGDESVLIGDDKVDCPHTRARAVGFDTQGEVVRKSQIGGLRYARRGSTKLVLGPSICARAHAEADEGLEQSDTHRDCVLQVARHDALDKRARASHGEEREREAHHKDRGKGDRGGQTLGDADAVGKVRIQPHSGSKGKLRAPRVESEAARARDRATPDHRQRPRLGAAVARHEAARVAGQWIGSTRRRVGAG